MKYFFGILLVAALASCSDKAAQPQQQPATRPTLVPKGSALVKADSSNPYAPLDVSPMDMSYFPVDYPLLKMSGRIIPPPVARVIYSRPHRGGRTIFGSLLPYGQPWRLGANEATEIELFQNITIQNKKLPRGRYILYVIPYADKWTIVFNQNLYTWGLKTDPGQDAARFDIPVQAVNHPVEYFSMAFNQTATGADLVMAWDTVVARLPLQF